MKHKQKSIEIACRIYEDETSNVFKTFEVFYQIGGGQATRGKRAMTFSERR